MLDRPRTRFRGPALRPVGRLGLGLGLEGHQDIGMDRDRPVVLAHEEPRCVRVGAPDLLGARDQFPDADLGTLPAQHPPVDRSQGAPPGDGSALGATLGPGLEVALLRSPWPAGGRTVVAALIQIPEDLTTAGGRRPVPPGFRQGHLGQVVRVRAMVRPAMPSSR